MDALSDLAITPWTPELELPTWACDMPGPDLVHSWCPLVAASSGGRVEVHAWCIGDPAAPEALASVHVVRGVNLAAYIGAGVEAIGRGLARVGLRPFEVDIAFCELPLLHLPGFMVSPEISPTRRVALWEAFSSFTRRALKVDLFAARVLPDSAEARGSSLPCVPFFASYVIALPDDGWKQSMRCSKRKKINYLERKLVKLGGRAEILAEQLPDAATLSRLYQHTLDNNAESLQHPVHMGPELLAALEHMPSDQRWIVAVHDNHELVAFCLALRTGKRMLLRTCGVDPEGSRPIHGYFQLDYAAIPFAESIGCEEVDMGPTSEGPKQRLGAVPEPTAYLMEFRSLLLAPLRVLLAARFRSESQSPVLEEAA